MSLSRGLFHGIHASRHHTCQFSIAGTLHCWGANDSGQLGYGHSLRENAPPATSRTWAAPPPFSSPRAPTTPAGNIQVFTP
ncbi:hypothetical protein [Archangium sp.]|uniref:hypothetical protein n=1 Tax=Archangium sp. TaxID=1872627 RepID=UPI0039C88301